MLDAAGYTDTTICLSNGLNEFTIKDLLEQGAEVDTFGVGDNLTAPNDRLGGVYKLVAVEDEGEVKPRIKVSEDGIKTINPGYKKVYRFYDKDTGYALGDVIALSDEIIPEDKYTLVHPVETWKKTELSNYDVRELQVPIFKDGELVYDVPTLEETREYAEEEFQSLYPEVTRLNKPHGYYVDLSDKLRELKKELIKLRRTGEDKGKALVKK